MEAEGKRSESFICRDFFNYIWLKWRGRGRVVKFNFEAVSFQLVLFNCFCNFLCVARKAAGSKM